MVGQVGVYRLHQGLAPRLGEARFRGTHKRTGKAAYVWIRVDVPEQHARELLKQARLWARVGHAHIGAVVDMGCTAHKIYWASPAHDNSIALDEHIRREGRLANALEVLLPVVHGLTQAHAEGAVHGTLDASAVELVPGQPKHARLIPRCHVVPSEARADVRAMANLLRHSLGDSAPGISAPGISAPGISAPGISATLNRALSSVPMTMQQLYDGLVSSSPLALRQRMAQLIGDRDDLVRSGLRALC